MPVLPIAPPVVVPPVDDPVEPVPLIEPEVVPSDDDEPPIEPDVPLVPDELLERPERREWRPLDPVVEPVVDPLVDWPPIVPSVDEPDIVPLPVDPVPIEPLPMEPLPIEPVLDWPPIDPPVAEPPPVVCAPASAGIARATAAIVIRIRIIFLLHGMMFQSIGGRLRSLSSNYRPVWARWSNIWSLRTKAIIASTTGTPRIPTHGS